MSRKRSVVDVDDSSSPRKRTVAIPYHSHIPPQRSPRLQPRQRGRQTAAGAPTRHPRHRTRLTHCAHQTRRLTRLGGSVRSVSPIHFLPFLRLESIWRYAFSSCGVTFPRVWEVCFALYASQQTTRLPICDPSLHGSSTHLHDTRLRMSISSRSRKRLQCTACSISPGK